MIGGVRVTLTRLRANTQAAATSCKSFCILSFCKSLNCLVMQWKDLSQGRRCHSLLLTEGRKVEER